MKPSKVGGGYTGIRIRGVMVERYKSLALLIILAVFQVALLGVSDHCAKNPSPISYPHKHIYLKSYGLDCISCTIFARDTRYKYLLLVSHAITDLLVCGHKGGG